MPTFTILVNNKVLGTYVVKKTVISIGRSRTNTISIASKAVSRTHVRLELTREGWSVADLGSLNGTYVNDIRVTSAFLSEDDKVTVGAYTILFSPEPALDASVEEQRPEAQPEPSDGTDTDVRVEGSPPATETAIAPPKELPSPAAEQGTARAVVHTPPETGNFQITAKQFIDDQEERAEDEDAERKKANRLSLLRSNPAGLQLEDRVRLAIFENPLADDTDIRKRLSDGDFGGATIGRSDLQLVLKKLNLDTKIKRYQYFLHS